MNLDKNTKIEEIYKSLEKFKNDNYKNNLDNYIIPFIEYLKEIFSNIEIVENIELRVKLNKNYNQCLLIKIENYYVGFEFLLSKINYKEKFMNEQHIICIYNDINSYFNHNEHIYKNIKKSSNQNLYDYYIIEDIKLYFHPTILDYIIKRNNFTIKELIFMNLNEINYEEEVKLENYIKKYLCCDENIIISNNEELFYYNWNLIGTFDIIAKEYFLENNICKKRKSFL